MIPAKVNAIHRLRRRSAVHLNRGIYPTSLSEYLEAPFISDTLGVAGKFRSKKIKNVTHGDRSWLQRRGKISFCELSAMLGENFI